MQKVPETDSAHSPEAVLKTAWEALDLMQKNSLSLDEYLDDLNSDPVMRRRAGSLLFAYFRNLKRVEKSLLDCCRKPPEKRLRELLSLALAMAHFQSSLPAQSVVNIAVTLIKKEFDSFAGKFANAVLRKALQNIKTENCDLLPNAVASRWRKEFGREKTLQLSELFAAVPPDTVRLRSKFTPAVSDDMQIMDWDLPWKFYTCTNLGKLLQSSEFADGAFYIQDAAPAMIGNLLKKYAEKLPSEVTLLDLCAAPGGKFIMDHELLTDCQKIIKRAVAVDRSARRLKLVQENCRRCGINADFIAGDASEAKLLQGELFDLVTCDVPCSNSGVFRRRPDALHRWKSAELKRIVPLQKAILNNAAAKCAPGGLLLYSTCSLEKEENQAVIEDFLAQNPGFELLESQLFMPAAYNDGTFGAVMRRKS